MSPGGPRWTATLVTASTAALLTGCGSGDDTSGGGSDGLTVVAGFYPLEWTAARVGGDEVSVSSLTPSGGEAHDHEHGTGCGHRAAPHEDHVDHDHDGHLHAAHLNGAGVHHDEHGTHASAAPRGGAA